MNMSGSKRPSRDNKDYGHRVPPATDKPIVDAERVRRAAIREAHIVINKVNPPAIGDGPFTAFQVRSLVMTMKVSILAALELLAKEENHG